MVNFFLFLILFVAELIVILYNFNVIYCIIIKQKIIKPLFPINFELSTLLMYGFPMVSFLHWFIIGFCYNYVRNIVG